MKADQATLPNAVDLRERAEARLGARRTSEHRARSAKATNPLMHELQVHQIELEMQNDELRRQQAELDAARARYFGLYDLAPVGYVTVSEQGLILESNLTAATLLGLPRGELVKQPITRYILKDDQDSYYRFRKQVAKTGEPQACELRMTKADGSPFWVNLEANAAQDSGGEPVYRVVLSSIDQRKRAEEEKEKLAELDRRKDQFLAMLSHELRNPLAPILNAVQLLQLQKGGTPVQEKALAIIERQVGQLTHLVGDLMEVSRAITGRIQLCREPVAVAGIVERAVETSRPLIDRRGHELRVSLPPEPIWLNADAARLAQVITNLLTNAAKYTNEGGRIWLSARQEGNKVVICVRDTGLGIASDFLPHVFELFTQAEQSSDRSQGGLGIGLTLVKRLVEMHEGTIAVSSVPGQGSEFVVSLDVCPPRAIAIKAQSTQNETPGTPEPALRLLLADDKVAPVNASNLKPSISRRCDKS